MWKHFGILLFGLVAVSNALATPLEHPIVLSAEAKERILHLISQRLMNELATSGIRPSSSILAIADPAALDDAVIKLPNDLGIISAWDSTVSGASQITTFFDVSVGLIKSGAPFMLSIPAGVSFMLGIPSLRIEGQHEAVIRLHRFLKMTSHKDYSVELTNARVDAEFQLRISFGGDITVESVSSYIDFEALKITTGGTYLNKNPINIEGLSSFLPVLWSSVWPDLKPTVDSKVQEFANELLKPCNAYTLVLDEDYSCLVISRPSPPPDENDPSYFMYSEPITNWGIWANNAERCPDELFVTGFQLKTEGWTAGDNTALNAIRFYCGNTKQSSIKSIEGKWGDWGDTYSCSNGQYANGFQLRTQGEQGGGILEDDTAANNLRIFCTGNVNYIEGDGRKEGDWRSVFMCKSGFAICGLKTQVEPDQSGTDDDTALNNIAALCCPLPTLGIL